MAALLTPQTTEGGIDTDSLERSIEFLLKSGVTGVVVAGGTGEYPALSPDERKHLLASTLAVTRKRVPVICCNGAARLSDSVALAVHAFEAGTDAVLLPAPHFFRYEQDDLESFYREAARRTPGPMLLYSLDMFTSPVETALALRLIESVPNIIGIKDSSGNLQTLQALTTRPELGANRILGHDRVLADALRADCLDAVISGPGAVVPELVVALFESRQSGNDAAFTEAAGLMQELLARFATFPYPWVLKWIAEWRGLFPASFPFAPSDDRKRQAAQLEPWFRDWLGRCEQLAGAAATRPSDD